MAKSKSKGSVGDQFLKEYLSRGLGNMPKREIDVFIFHLMRERGDFAGKPISDISRILKITPTRVKSLMYDASLRFEKQLDDDLIRSKLNDYFNESPIIDLENDKVLIQFEDPLLKDGFEALAKKELQLVDGSFGSEIVKIKKSKFGLVLKGLLSEKEAKKLDKELEKHKVEGKKSDVESITDTVIDETNKHLISELLQYATIDNGIRFGKFLIGLLAV
ncbi:MAG: hypothetical protein CL666_07520 [Balneola sp.]|nr:hypothetical protein [Balneola sp.]|tara:strand:+ start:98047 stop:98703 length:657 start_codon:yes stop_codon:yes gene_type:complete